MSIFETNIELVLQDQSIYAISDIHGDIDSFIISLRDCAKVIRKKAHFMFTNEKYDDDLKKILNRKLHHDNDYNLNADEYDLNYEWIPGNNSYIVICGDIIDPQRPDGKHCLQENGDPCHYYPQIELKILMFINTLNKQALVNGGRIIKLFGNHELHNTLGEISFISNYAFEKDTILGNDYYHGIARTDIFKPGKLGFDLLIKNGIGIVVKINDFVFVHANLGEWQFKKYETLNNQINTQRHTVDSWYSIAENPIIFDNNKGILWSREHDEQNNDPGLCSNLNKYFNIFCKETEFNERNLKLVVGHCVQANFTIFPTNKGITYTNKIGSDSISDTYAYPVYDGVADSTNRDKIFGITMKCPITDGTDSYQVYRIDSASGRGNDFTTGTTTGHVRNKTGENTHFYSKTPQVLLITRTGEFGAMKDIVTIIKSTMLNTRIHLPRPLYEKFIDTYSSTYSDIKELQLTSPNYYPSTQIPTPVSSYMKYLKYKNKYLQLTYIIKNNEIFI